MKKYIPSLLIIVSVLMFYSCAAIKTSIEPGNEKFRKDAFEKLGPGAVFLFNNKGSYVIAYKQNKPAPENPMPPLRFYLYSIEGNSPLFEDAIPAGSVRWKNDYTLEVSITPGNVKADGEVNSGYLYDVVTKTKKINSSIINQE